MSKAGIFTATLEVVVSEVTFTVLCFGILKLAKALLEVEASGSLTGALDFSTLSLSFGLGEVAEAK